MTILRIRLVINSTWRWGTYSRVQDFASRLRRKRPLGGLATDVAGFRMQVNRNTVLKKGICAAVGLLTVLVTSSVVAKVFTTQDDALSRAFPGAEIRRNSVFLTGKQVERIEKQGRIKLRSPILVIYEAFRDGGRIGTAYFDAHRVRTLPETLMIIVDLENRICDINVLEFKEPPEYLPRPTWYKQFLGRKLDSELSMGRGVDGVTGATLTARATVNAARRALAIHDVLEHSPQPDS
jgi:Na+-translocating ferredoxin:NAD+ oxidoreductase RnfG subunit